MTARRTPAPSAADSGEALRVLVLSKRQYMGHDLLDDRYGRFRELPLALARLGAAVEGLCLSYRPRPEGVVDDDAAGASVRWHAANARRLLPGPGSYFDRARRIAEGLQPHVVWGGSDALHAVLGRRVARLAGARQAIDLYDNFESYPIGRIPGVNRLLRHAVRQADAVSCVSEPLLRLVADSYGAHGELVVVENAVPVGLFVPGDRSAARAALGLPPHAALIGTAGALSASRGIGVLFDAYRLLRASRPELQLVVAGALDGTFELPRDLPGLHYLGLLRPEQVPGVLAALDVAVVSNVDSAFGRYCFPQKLYESLACRVPVAVARVGAMAALLSAHPQHLFEAGQPASLARTIEGLLRDPRVPPLPIPSWDSLGLTLHALLRRAAGLAAG